MTTNDKYDPNKQTCASWDCKNLARPGYSHCDEHLKAVNDNDGLRKSVIGLLSRLQLYAKDRPYSVTALDESDIEYTADKIMQLIDQTCEQRVREETWKYRQLGYVDATPDENYAVRILQNARQDCDIRVSTSTATETSNPFTDLMNELQEKRAAELDRAIAQLTKKGDNK